MAKIKTHSATAKRFSLTKSGNVKLNHSHRRHKLGLKDSKRKRSLRKASYVSDTRMDDLKRLLPYS